MSSVRWSSGPSGYLLGDNRASVGLPKAADDRPTATSAATGRRRRRSGHGGVAGRGAAGGVNLGEIRVIAVDRYHSNASNRPHVAPGDLPCTIGVTAGPDDSEPIGLAFEAGW